MQGDGRTVDPSYKRRLHLPSLSRWFIRTALAYLLLAFVAGVITPLLRGASQLWPTYVHLLVLGWLTQLIFGVAYWMFPRPLPQASRQGERLGWPTYWLFNTGLLLRIVGEGSWAAGREMNAVLVPAAMLQLIAGWSFVLMIWPRVRGR